LLPGETWNCTTFNGENLMSIRNYRLAPLGLALGMLGFVAACSQPGSPVSPSAAGGPTAVVGQPEIGSFELCKTYVGAVGPAVTFNIQIDTGSNGSIDDTTSAVLGNGQCQEFVPTAIPTSYIVTEVVPAGYTASSVLSTFIQDTGQILVGPTVPGNVATGFAGGDRGQLLRFTNTADEEPPGLEGCTPGYWKQPQHFDSWPAPYTPSTLFSSVFENAFPGMTLLQVASQGGGGLNALGRHTVAALLNAASGGVDYPWTVQQVINAFNGVFPGGDYETLKNQLEGFNELGCPLD
jgi:hypothetical protein